MSIISEDEFGKAIAETILTRAHKLSEEVISQAIDEFGTRLREIVGRTVIDVANKEAVIDGSREVRVTVGVYLPVDHECPRTRVYDLRGNLLEVIC